MTEGLRQVKTALADTLESAGLCTVAAFSPTAARRYRQPVAAIGLRTGESRGGAMGSYLGLKTGTDGTTRELYGMKLEMKLSVDLYAPAESGAEGCDQALETVHHALLYGLPSGLKPTALLWEELGWDEASSMFLRKGTLSCDAFFTAEKSEDAVWLRDFILRGVLTK